MGLRETGILTSVSDYHIFLKLKKTRRQAMDSYLDIVRSALEAGVTPRCHLEDITRADFYGFVVPFVQELMRLAEEAKMPVKIRACDTLGYGVTYPGASMPRSVQRHHATGWCTTRACPASGWSGTGTTTSTRCSTNAATAWLYGCAAANGTLLGIGERTGNTPIEGLVFEYIGLRGTDNGMQPQVITEIAEYFEQGVRRWTIPTQPAVRRPRLQRHPRRDSCRRADEGRGDLQHLRHRRDPEPAGGGGDLGYVGRGRDRALDQRVLQAGRRSSGSRRAHPGVAKIVAAIAKEYEGDRTTTISNEEMEAFTAQCMPEIAEMTASGQ